MRSYLLCGGDNLHFVQGCELGWADSPVVLSSRSRVVGGVEDGRGGANGGGTDIPVVRGTPVGLVRWGGMGGDSGCILGSGDGRAGAELGSVSPTNWHSELSSGCPGGGGDGIGGVGLCRDEERGKEESPPCSLSFVRRGRGALLPNSCNASSRLSSRPFRLWEEGTCCWLLRSRDAIPESVGRSVGVGKGVDDFRLLGENRCTSPGGRVEGGGVVSGRGAVVVGSAEVCGSLARSSMSHTSAEKHCEERPDRIVWTSF